MKSVDLSIIIVNLHPADYILACIQSIHEQTSDVGYEVIVVDNASFDNCGERLARNWPGVTFVQSQRNLGFGRANNLGAQYSNGEFLLFLNLDTEMRDRAIDRLYEQIQKLDKPGAVGCRQLSSDGMLHKSCVQMLPTVLNQVIDADILKRLFPKSGLWATAALFEDGNAQIEVVSGACLMIEKLFLSLLAGSAQSTSCMQKTSTFASKPGAPVCTTTILAMR